MLQTNYLGHWLLLHKITDKLIETATFRIKEQKNDSNDSNTLKEYPVRIVWVSSGAHTRVQINMNEWNDISQNTCDYGQSK